MTTSYDYDEAAASNADNAANRIDQSAAYIGTFKKVEAVTSSKGTEGIHFEFDSPGSGAANFDLWTRKMDEDGKPKTLFGLNMVQAMMAVLGLKGLKAVKGIVSVYDEDAGKRIEADGEVFPDLVGKSIGVILQRELYTKRDGGESFRMNLYGVFHAESKLTASELKEKKIKGEKLERLLRGLKDKDSRKAASAEPSQPSIGLPSGSY